MTFIAPLDLSTQPPVPVPWTIAPAPQEYMREILARRDDLEGAFIARGDLYTRTIVAAAFVGWGTSNGAPLVRADMGEATIHLHSHPVKYERPTPSPADLQCAMQLGELGLGLGIVNMHAGSLLMVREPRPWRAPSPFTSRAWSRGPLTFIWTTKTKELR